ncbi:MAG: c-type cytochrome [Caulobacteraceae bacterium]
MLGVAALGFAFGFVIPRSEALLSARHPLAPSPVRAAAGDKAEGQRLSYVLGCRSCHDKGLTGAPMSLSSSTLMAPNLTRLSRRTDAELDAAIRQGLRPDGRSELAMPSQAYAGLTDSEVAALIAYVRSLPPSGEVLVQPPYGIVLRMNLATGALKTQADRHADAAAPVDAGANTAPGRHIAQIACSQCHGPALEGGRGYPAPDLTIRGYYDRKPFHTVMRTGEGLPRDMKLMSETASSSLSRLTDGEIDALYDYLIARDVKMASRKR